MANVNFVFVLTFFLLSLSVVSCSGVGCDSDTDTSELNELKQDDPRLVKCKFFLYYCHIFKNPNIDEIQFLVFELNPVF